MKEKIIFLVGPTAVGKTEVALCLAKKIGAEIISCDSMQIYKEMDIISSKPSSSMRKKVHHHVVDYVSPSQEHNVSRYRKEVLKKVKQILDKSKIPLFVGGSGLYVKAVIDGIFPGSSADKIIRARLYKEAEDFGRQRLFIRLKKVDPQAASHIHPNDLRRVVRALEVYEKTKIPISEWQKKRQGITDDYEVKIFGLIRRKKDLYRNIDKRLDWMFKKGLIKEVRRLLDLGLSKTARQALGINEIAGYLNGEYGLSEAKELLRRNTYRYVKKQLTWFRKDKRINWIEVRDSEGPKKIAQRIWKRLYWSNEAQTYGNVSGRKFVG